MSRLLRPIWWRTQTARAGWNRCSSVSQYVDVSALCEWTFPLRAPGACSCCSIPVWTDKSHDAPCQDFASRLPSPSTSKKYLIRFFLFLKIIPPSVLTQTKASVPVLTRINRHSVHARVAAPLRSSTWPTSCPRRPASLLGLAPTCCCPPDSGLLAALLTARSVADRRIKSRADLIRPGS